MNCPFCHKKISENAKFCSDCGKKIPRCPQCGTPILYRQRFCVQDGTPLSEEIVAGLPSVNQLSEVDDISDTAHEKVLEREAHRCRVCGKSCAEDETMCADCVMEKLNRANLAARNRIAAVDAVTIPEREDTAFSRTIAKKSFSIRTVVIGILAFLLIGVISFGFSYWVTIQKTTDLLLDASAETTDEPSTASWEKNILMSDPGVVGDLSKENGMDSNELIFGHDEYYRSEITMIKVLDQTASAPADAWDVSQAQDGTVLAWVNEDRELLIAGDGGVCAPEDCTGFFAYYTGATEIDFNNAFHTENTINMYAMFYHCENASVLSLYGMDTSKVTTMCNMFTADSALMVLEGMENWDTSNVTDMSNMFARCTSLVNLDLTNFNTENVKNMSGMFYHCDGLESLTIAFDTGNVENMSKMFYQCGLLKTLTFDREKFNTEKVTDMYAMFSQCNSLESLDVSGFDTGKVEDMSYMFKECRSLTKLNYEHLRSNAPNAKTEKWLDGTIWE